MDILEQYQQKTITPSQILEILNSDKRSTPLNLILAMSVAMPPKIISELALSLKSQPSQGLNIYYMHGTEVLKDTLLAPELSNQVSPFPLFMSQFDRQALNNTKLNRQRTFVPSTFHQVGRILSEQIEPHCFTATVSPMDKHGYFSLGTNADYGASLVRKAKKIIIEVNENMPRTFGECSVHISEVDGIIENTQPLIEIHPHTPNTIDLKIATQIAQRIDNGDTLQVGVGGVPNAVLGLLEHHQNLGLHSELFCPAMVKLIQTGVINGRLKSWMQHKHVFTLALGDKAMYDFMDDNPSIVGYPASWVNNPTIIAKNNNMVSINTAIEIDLTGQINAEQIDGQPFSGTGGQLDFVRGAYSARNGRSFIALQSTAKKGSISRIVPQLKGGSVTDTRMDSHFIVTEYGCINLKGLSLSQRAKGLIALAHPDFRPALQDQAQILGLL